MKLKLIKDSEMVVSKTEYELLKTAYSQMRDLEKEIAYGKPIYYVGYSLGYPVVKVTNKKTSFIIKEFYTNDQEYNRVCAEELVELLSQEQ